MLPENLLRFYIQFSAPMSRGEAYQHIRLLDAAGKPVADPFLELDEELWSRDGRRFTLLFDPGRIKRGLKPREEVGPVLEAGKSYTLVIDRPGPTPGQSARSRFRKSFRVGPPDQDSPSPGTGRSRPPRAGTRHLLEVDFRSRSTGLGLPTDLVAGRTESRSSRVRRVWKRPRPLAVHARRAWTGRVSLVVGTDLEDLAATPWAGRSRSTWPGRSRRGSKTETCPGRFGSEPGRR